MSRVLKLGVAEFTILDAKISVDGSTVAFVADEEVYVMPVNADDGEASNKPVQITSGARGVEGRTNGVADYLAMEELSRPEGMFLFGFIRLVCLLIYIVFSHILHISH